MSPELRRLSLKLLVTLYALHIIVNRALPSLSLVNAQRSHLPNWIGLFFANAATLAVVIVLADLGMSIFRRNAFSGAVLVLLAALGLAMPLLAVPGGNTYLLAVGIVSTVTVFGGLAVTHQLPVRAYHALAWLCAMAALSQAFAIRGHAMPSDWSFWVVGSIHVMVFFSCAAVFGAWGVPSRQVPMIAVASALMLTVALSLVVAIGGRVAASVALPSFGLAPYFPLWLYTLAGFLFATAVFVQLTSLVGQVKGTSLLLLVLAGCSFSETNAVLLSALALTLLVVSYPRRTQGILADWRAAFNGYGEVSRTEVSENLAH